MDDRTRERQTQGINRPVACLLVAAVLLGCTWIWRIARSDSAAPFLLADGSAEWIVYPKPPDASPHDALPYWAVFRQSFSLKEALASATLSVRVFKQGEVRINGRRVENLPLNEKDWKRRHTADVVGLLRPGTNEISVTVSNAFGPPALWLELSVDNGFMGTGPQWEVSLVGAAPQKAVSAGDPPVIRRGNNLFGRELMIDSVGKTWPVLLLIIVGVAIFVSVGNRRLWGEGGRASFNLYVLLGAILLLWLALYWNNLPRIAALLGFDRDGHLQYIDYILKQRALPLADQGWQMYQPPLFYLLSALIVGPFGGTAFADSAVLALRAASAITGMAHLVLIFLSLRLLFPKQPGRQAAGLVVAGFLPALLCLSHHITNENLSAVFVTAALYFTLRHLRSEKPGLGLIVAIGSCLGLAMLTKFSALLVIPVVLGAAAWKELHSRASGASSPRAMWRQPALWRPVVWRMCLALATGLAFCGWHYLRVWRRFGNPLIGNWDPRLSFAWWQDPGYHTAGWYGRFGEALVRPLYSGLTGFADGMYVTLWGDGLCSGSTVMSFRPQWNYHLMNVGYLLSLLLAALLLLGIVVALIRFVHQPSPEWFLILGVIFAFAFGVGLMSLQVASYAQVKAFYALPSLLPFSAAIAVGWDFVRRRSGRWSLLLPMALAVWAVVNYAAFWIRDGNVETHTARAVGFADKKRYAEAADEFSRALKLDPRSLEAQVGLAAAWRQLGRLDEARRQTALALKDHPDEPEAEIEAGVVAAMDQRYPEAVELLVKAVGKAPDHPTAHQQLAVCLAAMRQHKLVIEVCEQGLRVDPFNADLHHTLAIAEAETGNLTNAVAHLRLALALKRKWPEAQGLLALALESLGQQEEALAQYAQATRELPDDAQLRCRYATALAAHGDAREAVAQYGAALALKPDFVEALRKLAWTLATDPAESVRNGAEAVRLARKACDLTQDREAETLLPLAAAYAEAGEFAQATVTAQKAHDLALAAGAKGLALKCSQVLDSCRAEKPYRESLAGMMR